MYNIFIDNSYYVDKNFSAKGDCIDYLVSIGFESHNGIFIHPVLGAAVIIQEEVK